MHEGGALVIAHPLDVISEAGRGEIPSRSAGSTGVGSSWSQTSSRRIRTARGGFYFPRAWRRPCVPRTGSKLGKRSFDRGDVACATTLRGELATGPNDGRQMPEQRIVVRDPVERRGRQDRVDRFGDRKRRGEVGHEVLDARIGSEPFAGALDHGGRAVERHHKAPRRPREQHRRHASGAAPGVEHALGAGEVEPVDDRCAPARHGRGQPVVRCGVSVSGHSPGGVDNPTRGL